MVSFELFVCFSEAFARRYSVKKVLNILQNLQENTSVVVSSLIKTLCNFIKKEAPIQMFPREFCEFLWSTSSCFWNLSYIKHLVHQAISFLNIIIYRTLIKHSLSTLQNLFLIFTILLCYIAFNNIRLRIEIN